MKRNINNGKESIKVKTINSMPSRLQRGESIFISDLFYDTNLIFYMQLIIASLSNYFEFLIIIIINKLVK